MTAAVRVRGLTIEYDSGGYAVRPVENFDLDVASGEIVVLLGPSGCGKTSLLSAIGGILRPAGGSIEVDGVDIAALSPPALAEYRRRTVGFVFQAFNLIPSLTARENVALPLVLAGTTRREAYARADLLLHRVGIADRASHRPAKLSGGQQQRVAVARGLAGNPPLLLADEPTANLDYIQAEGIVSLLRDLRSSDRAIIVSTHDDRLVRIADRAVHLVSDFRGDDAPPATVELEPGQVVFEQGERGELVYVVDAGRVAIVRRRSDGTDEALAELGPGEYFGELGPLFGFPRTATARAVTAARLTAYSVHDFRDRVLPTAKAPGSASAALTGPAVHPR